MATILTNQRKAHEKRDTYPGQAGFDLIALTVTIETCIEIVNFAAFVYPGFQFPAPELSAHQPIKEK